jgi:hypothetical protein
MTEIVGCEHRVRLKAFGIADGIDAEFEILRWQAMSTAQPFRLRGHIVLPRPHLLSPRLATAMRWATALWGNMRLRSATFGGFSADVVARYAKDAVSLLTFSGSEPPAGYNPDSILQATLANIAAVLVAARYKWDRTEIYGGYTYARIPTRPTPFRTGSKLSRPAFSFRPGR